MQGLVFFVILEQVSALMKYSESSHSPWMSDLLRDCIKLSIDTRFTQKWITELTDYLK